MFEALFAAFSLIAVSEFGDRSQVAALLLGAKYHNQHKKVFAGAITAFAALFFIAVVLGNVVLAYIPENILRIFSSLAFIGMGLYIFLQKEEKVKIRKDKKPFLASFSLIALSEIGDKTQVAAIILASSFRDPVGTFAGAMIAETLLTGMAIFAGRLIARRIRMHWIKYVSGVVFVIFGLLTLMQ
ncbi:MAG: TMEM165/GDT1 family protein [Candidatus Aenigmarchaeota archaeon]|nr:TMEM165/GDT1 family protein [Candidatus Aenigmarchaeota archaeon]